MSTTKNLLLTLLMLVCSDNAGRLASSNCSVSFRASTEARGVSASGNCASIQTASSAETGASVLC